MTSIIIDDNEQAALELKRQLGAFPDMQVAGIAGDSFHGLTMVTEKRPDVIFLDVEMPGANGLDFLDRAPQVRDGLCRVVMYTAHAQYMMPAMRKQAFDVLLKPIDPGELATIVSRLREATGNREKAARKDTATLQDRNSNMILLYTNSVDFRLVNKNDIGLFRYNSTGRCWEAVLGNRDTPVAMKHTIKAHHITDIDPDTFIQVNQKYIINVSYLIEVVDSRCHFFPPFDKVDYVTVGCSHRRKLIDRFFSL